MEAVEQAGQPMLEDRGHQEGLPRTPEVQAQVNKLFAESGLAARAFSSLHAHANQFINYRGLTTSVGECNFGVTREPEITEDHRRDPNKMETRVVIEFPNPDPMARENQPRLSERFKVRGEGMGFGYKSRQSHWEREDRVEFTEDERPLTKRQKDVIEQALRLLEAEKARHISQS